jgi:mRNA-degrading endonuclease RelE of RelBE toxin-antitoxin system
MAYDIEVHQLAVDELDELRAYDQRIILDEIEQQLSHEPTVPTRRRKRLISLVPAFEYVPPIWQLRVGDFRVFYDVDEESKIVHVRAVRRKMPSQQTDDVT